MERIAQLDIEIAGLIQLLSALVPMSTQNQNVHLGISADYLIRALAEYHAEKIQLLGHVNNQRMHSITMDISQEEDEEEEDEEEEDEEEEDEDDDELTQLADRMEESHGSPIEMLENSNIQWSQFVEGEWPQIEQDWTDAQPEEDFDQDQEPHPNITIRRPVAIRVTNARCVRKFVSLYGESRLCEPNKESCGVCFETPLMRDACETSCGHHFCKDCFGEWETKCVTANVTCPTCRKSAPMITEYRPRRSSSSSASGIIQRINTSRYSDADSMEVGL